MPLVGLFARAFVVSLLAGTLLLPLADHHAAGHLDTKRQVLHHHGGDAAADESGAPLVVPGASAGLSTVSMAPAVPFDLALPPGPLPARWSPDALIRVPESLAEPPPAPPPQLAA